MHEAVSHMTFKKDGDKQTSASHSKFLGSQVWEIIFIATYYWKRRLKGSEREEETNNRRPEALETL